MMMTNLFVIDHVRFKRRDIRRRRHIWCLYNVMLVDRDQDEIIHCLGLGPIREVDAFLQVEKRMGGCTIGL